MKQGELSKESPTRRPHRKATSRAWRRVRAVAWLLAGAAGAQAQSVTFNGMLGERALLIIDGRAQTLPVGGSAQGVKLLKLEDNRAQIEIGGRTQQLRLGGSNAGGAMSSAANGLRITLPRGPGGHFTGLATINGHSVPFVIDTGATSVAIGRDEAERIGLDLGTSGAARAMTANGAVAARSLTLTTLRVGDVTVNDVPAIVLPQAMPFILLGNSFLSRFQMRNDSDMLVLEKKL